MSAVRKHTFVFGNYQVAARIPTNSLSHSPEENMEVEGRITEFLRREIAAGVFPCETGQLALPQLREPVRFELRPRKVREAVSMEALSFVEPGQWPEDMEKMTNPCAEIEVRDKPQFFGLNKHAERIKRDLDLSPGHIVCSQKDDPVSFTPTMEKYGCIEPTDDEIFAENMALSKKENALGVYEKKYTTIKPLPHPGDMTAAEIQERYKEVAGKFDEHMATLQKQLFDHMAPSFTRALAEAKPNLDMIDRDCDAEGMGELLENRRFAANEKREVAKAEQDYAGRKMYAALACTHNPTGGINGMAAVDTLRGEL